MLETFKVPGLTLFEAFNRVALQVREKTYDSQEPWNSYSGISNDFYMLPPAKPAPPTTGIIALEVSPESAVLRLGGQPKGQANNFRSEIAAGTHEYEIAADGYETRHGTVMVPAGGEKSMVLSLTSINRPPPPPPPRITGNLELDVATPGAMLKLDGKDLGPAKGFRQEVTAGRHEIVLTAQGFEPQRQTVVIPAGGDKSLVIALAPVPTAPAPPSPPTTGLLELQVSTPGAVVRLDGKPLGLAKGFRRELPVGQHELEILAEGYEPAKQAVTIAPGVERSVMVALVALPKATPPPAPAAPAQNERSTLVISTDPSTAAITVDGVRQPRAGSAQLEVTPGEHVIIAGGQGLVQQQLQVRVGAGERVQVPLQLARVPPPQPRAVAQPRRPAAREEAPAYAPVAPRTVEPPQPYRAPAVVAPASQAPAAPSPSAKCFTFNGRQFCE